MLESHGVFMDLNWLLKLMFWIIILGVGLILLGAKRKRNSNELDQNLIEDSEQEQLIDHRIETSLEEDDELGDRTATSGGHPGAYGGCSFCGRLCKTLRCSRCKTARYCSAECNIIHWGLWHKYECVEIETAADDERLAPPNSRPENEGSYARHEVDYKKEDEDDKPSNDEPGDGSTVPVAVSNYDGFAVCGNPSIKKCSIRKVINYGSAECQNMDWTSGHKVQCIGENVNSTVKARNHQARPANGNNSLGEEHDHSSGRPSLRIFPEEGTTNSKLLIGSSQEATQKALKETAEQEQLRSLKEEVQKSRIENAALRSERNSWEARAKFASSRLFKIMKESEHQLFSLKREKEMISKAEEQAHHMVQSLSEKLHRLQIEEHARASDKKRLEEYIQILQNECNKAKRARQEERDCIQMLNMEHEKATKFAIKQAEETGRKLENAFHVAAAAESRAAAAEAKLYNLDGRIIPADNKVVRTDSLSRDSIFSSKQVCTICLNNEKDLAFGCGHMTCRDCASKLSKCPICREKITSRVKLFPG